jgi:1,4-alpha-glucan branching enzyme
MDVRYALSLVLNAHLPFVREYSAGNQRYDGEENWFFEALSETYLPLLETFDRLEGDHIPFRLGLAISPVFCQMLNDEALLEKYIAYTDRQIEFGRQEVERTADNPELHPLAKRYFDTVLDRRILFTERYEGNILRALSHYQRKGKIEIMATAATHAFLPFLASFPESVQAQIETALSSFRHLFGIRPMGFWLPEMGWTGELEPYLRMYNFGFTIVESHGLAFGRPVPSRGTYYPVKTPSGIFMLARDFYASQELRGLPLSGPYRDNNRDAGYELPLEHLGPFHTGNGARRRTGFKYWQTPGAESPDALYNPAAALAAVEDHARAFLEGRVSRLVEAGRHMREIPVCLCAENADSFGRFWHEGPRFLETLFRLAAGYRDLQFMTPSEYLCKQRVSSLETSIPAYSSWGTNGYAETWLHSSCDWIYRHLARAMDRMVELAERFPNETGIREQALNHAACELMLAQASDWPRFLYRQEAAEYAQFQAESALRNFTTIYEALGSHYISTEWLTNLERRRTVFPHINYRVFRRKR